MRGAGAIVARVLAETSAAVRPGITTEELDRIAARIIRSMGTLLPRLPRLPGDHLRR